MKFFSVKFKKKKFLDAILYDNSIEQKYKKNYKKFEYSKFIVGLRSKVTEEQRKRRCDVSFFNLLHIQKRKKSNKMFTLRKKDILRNIGHEYLFAKGNFEAHIQLFLPVA